LWTGSVRTFMRLLALALALAAGLCGQQFPHIEGKNLLGQKMALPDAAAGHDAVVVIGFTHASQNQTKAWTARLKRELNTYSVAVLEDAPRLVRGMAVHGMKGGVPEDERSNFLVVDRDEKELKQAAAFDQPNDAYVLLLDKNGAILWKFHGPVTDAALAELKAKAG
jgi:ATP10 protein